MPRNGVAAGFPGNAATSDLVHAWFESWAGTDPGRLAVISGEDRLTYRELDVRADRLARGLRGLGVGPDAIVVICLRRSWRFVVAALAVLKAGGAYLPIDPAYPAERIAFLLADSGAVAIVTEPDLGSIGPIGDLPTVLLDDAFWLADRPAEKSAEAATPGNLAYVLYTSGSTGVPKGVLIEHHSLANLFRSTGAVLGVPSGAVWLASSNFSFDISIQEFLWPLCFGQTVVVFRGDESGESIPELILRHQVTHFQGTPSRALLLLEEPRAAEALARTRQLLLAGEALSADLVARLKRHLAGDLFNLYGPTETTIYSAGTRVEAGMDPVPIGRAMLRTDLHVVDEGMRPVAPGEIGELLIGGEGLARGYLGRPELTAERFVPNPFGGQGRVYRTGDLVRWRPDGMLDYLGRLDHQVKIRGYRIELGEIESRLRQIPEIHQAAVVARPQPDGSQELVALVTLRGEAVPTFESLRGELKRHLPDFFLPARILVLDTMPFTPSGKVDRKALLNADGRPIRLSREVVLPRDARERRLAELWRAVLGWESVGVHDNFFDLGGHSILAMRLTAAMRRDWGIDLGWTVLFTHPTIAELAERMASEESASGEPDGDAEGLSAGPASAKARASSAQEQMCFVREQSIDPATYNLPYAFRLRGTLDPDRLQAAWRSVVRRHEILRTRFVRVDGDLWQEVVDVPEPWMTIEDLSAAPKDEVERRLGEHLADAAREAIDLASAPLWRMRMYRLGDSDHVLLFNFQHALVDERAIRVVLSDLGTILADPEAGRATAWPERSRYLEFARRERRELDSRNRERLVEFWRRQLQGAPTDPGLPGDIGTGNVPSDGGEWWSASVDPAIRARMEKLAREEGGSVFMVGLAAYQVFLARLGGRADLVVGTPVSRRDRAEFQDTVGLFLNVLPIRARLDLESGFRENLRRVRESVLASLAHGSLPTAEIVQAAGMAVANRGTSFFRAMFVLLLEPWPDLAVPGTRVEVLPVHTRTAKADLSVFFTADAAGGWRLETEYSTDRFTTDTGRRISRQFQEILERLVTRPDAPLPALLDEVLPRPAPLPEPVTGRVVSYPREATVDGLFAKVVSEHGERLALVSSEGNLTYAQLDRRSRALARRLRAAGFGRGTPVGLHLDRSAEFVIGVLAVLRIGGFYVPLAPDHPPERNRFVIEDTGLPVILTRDPMASEVVPPGVTILELVPAVSGDRAEPGVDESDEAGAADLPIPGTGPLDPAYVMFTSGSTGKPKGVVVPHRAIIRLVHGQEYLPWGSVQRFLLLAPTAFDASTLELWGPLLHGAVCVVHPEPAVTLDGLETALREHHVTVLWLTAGLFNQIIDQRPEVLRPVRYLLTGGEALSMPHVRRALECLPDTRLINGYGPTEGTTFTTTFAIPPEPWPAGWNGIPIGRPLANTRCHVLDEDLQPVRPGEAGELVIGGDGVALGYWRRKELTEAAFLPDPFDPAPEARLYRSGDRVRWLADGQLEFLGRLDDQIKVRGHRIEPAEVESVLLGHPGVRAAAVFARAASDGGRELAVAIVPASAEPPTVASLRAHLRRSLPEPMIPTRWEVRDRLPLTANGKVDRRGLAEQPGRILETRGEKVPPRNPIETCLARWWQEAFGREGLGVHDDVFELGAHSLMAMRVAARASEFFEARIPVRWIFERPTIAGLAAWISSREGADQRRPKTAIPRLPEGSAAPLSHEELRLWFLHQTLPDSSAYHVPISFRIRGPLDAERLGRALATVADRHEALRTRYEDRDGHPARVVSERSNVVLGLEDFTGAAAEDREAAMARRLADEVRRPFDLRTGPLFRAVCLRLEPELHVLSLTLHHLITDEWSLRVMLRELGDEYRGDRTGPSAESRRSPVRYRDYAHWQQDRIEQGALREAEEFWRGKLAGAPERIGLPTDGERPTETGSPAGQFRGLLPAAIAEALEGLGRKEGVTPLVVWLAALNVLLHRAGGQEDLVLGIPFANRLRAELDEVLGFFVNTLPLRTRVEAGDSYRDLLKRVKAGVLEATEHGELPFDEIIRASGAGRPGNSRPLVQVMFGYFADPVGGLQLGEGRTAEVLPAHLPAAKFDLNVALEKQADGSVEVCWEYDQGVLGGAAVSRLAGQFEHLVRSIITAPDRKIPALEWVPEEHQRQTLDWGTDTQVPYPREATVTRLFEEQVRRCPAAPAVIGPDRELRYEELNEEASAWARALRRHGVKRGVPVGLYLERSVDFVVAVVAVLKAGGVYVPLTPDLPVDRLRTMVEELAIEVVVGRGAIDSAALGGVRVVNLDDRAAAPGVEAGIEPPEDRPEAGDPAYVMFTSGSTGRPKGVVVPHRAIVRLVCGTDYVPWGPDQRYLLLAPTAFDASTFELWGALLHGACCVVHPEAVPTLDGLERVLAVQRISALWLTAGLFNQIIDQRPEILRPVRLVLTGGEALSVPHVKRALAALPGTGLINGYGPTEGTTFSATHRIPRDEENLERLGRVPIGRPLANTRCYVLDDQGRLLPPGVPGELHIGGDGLALGYWGRPELTAAAFLPDPFETRSGARMYRSGDRVRWLGDGTLDFLGRVDNQVKIRGYRIEPGEVEEALLGHSDLKEIAVVARPLGGGGHELVAVMVAAEGREPSVSELRAHLQRRLPEPMIPTVWERVDQLPLNANGKVDRRALLATRGRDLRADRSFEAPIGRLEEKVAEVWQEVLGLDRVGRLDNFFDLGGHSLLGMRLISRLNQSLGAQLGLRSLFAARTVAALAEIIASGDDPASGGRHARLRGTREGTPFFYLPGFYGLGYLPRGLAAELGRISPYCDELRYRGVDDDLSPDDTIEGIAAHLCDQIDRLHPPAAGPICVGGFSFGAILAFEVALQFQKRAREVAAVFLYDGYMSHGLEERSIAGQAWELLRRTWRRPRGQRYSFIRKMILARLESRRPPAAGDARGPSAATADESDPGTAAADPAGSAPGAADGRPELVETGLLKQAVRDASLVALSRYQPPLRAYAGRVILFKAAEWADHLWFRRKLDQTNGWGPYLQRPLETVLIPRAHLGVMTEPLHSTVIARTCEIMRELQSLKPRD